AYFSHKGHGLYDQAPFERVIPGASYQILFLGDSTAVGTGAVDRHRSTAGYFANDFPQASITNISQNGLRLAGLIKVSASAWDHQRLSPSVKYSLIVLQIGANDIIHFTKLSRVKRDLAILLDTARA